MAKEFDIYLNKRLTECDIIVYSIPYRDGISAAHGLYWKVVLRAIHSINLLQHKLAPA